MARGRILLITVGGVLLVLSHAAAWRLGSGSDSSHPQAQNPSSVASTDPAATLTTADLIRLGREHEAAEQAARAESELPWPEQIAAARVKLPADADFPALVREGMAAAKGDRGGPTAETAAAFGKWLEADPEAAIEFIGRTRRDQSVYGLHSEIARWLGQGNEGRLNDLTKRFPLAWQSLMEGAQLLCMDRGADYALDLAAGLADPWHRLFMLMEGLSPEQWQGHLAKAPALFADPRNATAFLISLAGDKGAAVLLDEIRAAGFPPEAVARAEAKLAEREEYDRGRAEEEEQKRKKREESASALRRQLGLAAASLFDRDTPSEEAQLEKLAPGFADAWADLRDGRISMAEVLQHVQRSWPPASDPVVAADLREMLFETAFQADPLGALQGARAAGWNINKEAAQSLTWLAPEMAIRVVTAHPEILHGRESDASSIYYMLLEDWQQADPEACQQALLGLPDGELRTEWLEKFDANAKREEEQKEGGGP